MTTRRRVWMVCSVGLGTMLSTITLSIVNVALPTVATAFDADLPTVSWVVLGYLATVSGLHLSMGRLGDIFGRKRVVLAGYALFMCASVAAGLSPSLSWLIAARIVQAVGASVLQANEAVLYTMAFPAEKRGRAIGTMSLMAGAGLVIGPALGGLILEAAGWRAVFYLLAPWAGFALVVASFAIPSIPATTNERYDITSGALLLLWIGPAIYALNQGLGFGWTSVRVIVSLAACAVFLALFVIRQRRVANPLVDPSLFRSRPFRSGVLSAFLGFVSLSSVLLLAPFVLQNAVGLPVAQVGSLMSLYPVAAVVCSIPAGHISDRFGVHIPRTTGIVIFGFGFLAFAFLTPDAAMVHIIAALVLVGIGQVFWVTPNTSAILGAVPPAKLGIAGGSVAATRTFGWASGQALWGGVYAAAVFARVEVTDALAAPQDIQVLAFRTVFLIAALLAAATAVLSALKTPSERRGRAQRDDDR